MRELHTLEVRDWSEHRDAVSLGCRGVGGVGLGDGSAYHGRIKHPDSEDE